MTKKESIGTFLVSAAILLGFLMFFFGTMSLFQNAADDREYVYEWVIVEEKQRRFTAKTEKIYFKCNSSMSDDWIVAINGSNRIFDLEIGDKLTIKWRYFEGWRPRLIMSGWIEYPF